MKSPHHNQSLTICHTITDKTRNISMDPHHSIIKDKNKHSLIYSQIIMQQVS